MKSKIILIFSFAVPWGCSSDNDGTANTNNTDPVDTGSPADTNENTDDDDGNDDGIGGDTSTGDDTGADSSKDDEDTSETEKDTQEDDDESAEEESSENDDDESAEDSEEDEDDESEKTDEEDTTAESADDEESSDKEEESDEGEDEESADDGDDSEEEEDTAVDKCAECSGFKGVDLLVVVDNSISMNEEQQVLATGFFTLLNSLIAPTEDWEYDAAESVRVGIISSDLGASWGDDAEEDDLGMDVRGCVNSGDNGALLMANPSSINVATGQIKCDVATGGAGQCPDSSWTCQDGLCVSAVDGGVAEVECPAVSSEDYADSTEESPNEALAKQVACMAQLGTEGCGMEQPLQAGVRALSRDDHSFLRDDHLLAVVVVSDEEDCSIEDDGLFLTTEWFDPDLGLKNTACNLPEENETDYLYDPASYYQKLVDLKGGEENAVVFAAIVGVPNGEGTACQGIGDQLGGCLDEDAMKYTIQTFEILDEFGDIAYYEHFAPACERRDESNNLVTSARPGRRFVKLAQEFGCAGYVYSICNEDWSVAMTEIARIIAKCIVVVV